MDAVVLPSFLSASCPKPGRPVLFYNESVKRKVGESLVYDSLNEYCREHPSEGILKEIQLRDKMLVAVMICVWREDNPVRNGFAFSVCTVVPGSKIKMHNAVIIAIWHRSTAVVQDDALGDDCVRLNAILLKYGQDFSMNHKDAQ